MKRHDQPLVRSVRIQLQGGGGGNSIFKALMYMLKQVFCFPLQEKSTTENDYKPLNQPWIHLKDPLK